MSVLLVATALTATASVVGTGCVAYVLISFARSGQLLASRAGKQSLSAVLVPAANAHLHDLRKAHLTRTHGHSPPLFAS